MSGSLDRPIAAYAQPGADQQQRSLQEIADEFLAVVGADREITPDEQEVIQYFIAGLSAIATSKAGPPQRGAEPISNEAAPLDEKGAGTDYAEQAPPGQAYL